MSRIHELSREFSTEDLEAHKDAHIAARALVCKIRPLPDLVGMFRKAFGYGPHCDMLQHFCWWLNGNIHKGMRDRWSCYITYEQWDEAVRLNWKQVNKGNRRQGTLCRRPSQSSMRLPSSPFEAYTTEGC